MAEGAGFASLVMGEANELAVQAARRVAEAPGVVYNPLVVWGATGAGKTLLLHALLEEATAIERERTARLESAGVLAERISGALVGGGLEALAEAYGAFDILLLDDVHALAGLHRTQVEIATILGRRVAERRQVVLASAVAPDRLVGFDRSLRELLDHGLVAGIDLPDREMRGRIVRQLLERMRLEWPVQTIAALADYSLDGRALENYVARLAVTAGEDGAPGEAEVHALLAGEPREPDAADEFGSFLEDVSRTLAAVVEAEPWRRRIAEAILRREGEGIRTGRLNRALEAETPPDVDALLEGFDRDAARLLEIRRLLGAGPEGLEDPDLLDHAERRLSATLQGAGRPTASGEEGVADDFFLDPERVVLSYVDVERRLLEDPT